MSLFLFYFSVGAEQATGVMKFLNFTILLFGSGVTYHVLTELIACPQDKTNIKFWISILAILGKVILGFSIAGISLFIGQKLSGSGGYLLMILGLILGMLWASHHIISLHKPIRELVAVEIKE